MRSHSVFVAIVVLAFELRAFSTPSSDRTVTVNAASLDHARKLIANGCFVNDKRGEWAGHQASTVDENKFMKQHGADEYARWHLAIDESHRADTKARYKFPFGDFKNVHRCALIAAQNRARQYGYTDVENAATELLTLIEQKR
jgi:hypothetical protein